MASELSPDRERGLLRDLMDLTARRAEAEAVIASSFAERNRAATAAYQQQRKQLDDQLAEEKAKASESLQGAWQTTYSWFAANHGPAEKEYQAKGAEVKKRFIKREQEIQEEYQNALWTLKTADKARHERNESATKKRHRVVAHSVRNARLMQKQAGKLLASWGIKVPDGPPELPDDPAGAGDHPFRRLSRSEKGVGAVLRRLKRRTLTKWVRGWRTPVTTLFLAAAAAGVGAWQYAEDRPLGAGVAGGAALALGVVVWFLLRTRHRKLARADYDTVAQLAAETAALGAVCKEKTDAAFRINKGRLERRYDRDHKRIEAKYPPALAELRRRRDDDLERLRLHYEPKLESMVARRDRELGDARGLYEKAAAKIQKWYDTEVERLTSQHAGRKENSQRVRDSEFDKLVRTWHDGTDRAHETLDRLRRESARFFPDWFGPDWDAARAPGDLPAGMRFGQFAVDVDAFPGGPPRDERLVPFDPAKLALPALVPFSSNCSLLMRTHGDGRAAAIEVLQAVMLRFLTTLPPGKVRLTIIDPVGLGENFSAFMHLADYDEQLVTGRIWTESAHVEKRLQDLTGHMENVLQKYLRNQYASIEEYNEAAGEVAEPFRVLVVANFPVNFTAEATRRLISIMASGPACGVCPLVSVDTKQPVAPGMKVADLEGKGVQLNWREGRFHWTDPDLGSYPLALDRPPSNEVMTRTLQRVGADAKAAQRVEVPFEFVMPEPETWWKGDSAKGIEVPIGRSGATRRQYLRLGKGTAQHVLVAGKTGSGKSTLLHVLITNLSLVYSPEQVSVFLIDFKKGVEFKSYASAGLPHARVIAVESEREFGLSVLNQLDVELRRRGELFRKAGVADLPHFREAEPDTPCPRLLLIVDEFQEFFVEDDKLAQEAALLLDRLVRQGRAFGLHVVLGSQTLGGAYSLARSTIDQMAVRVALQCSEADANLILSKDNAAARLLSRPGEAIYNDANGLVEGNDPFQVVWISDTQRDELVRESAEMARRRPLAERPEPIIFEGSAAVDLERNPRLLAALAGDAGPAEEQHGDTAWLGEAIAIKDPTAAVFRQQGGNNLLLVGQNAENARGIFSSLMLSVAGKHRGRPADGLPAGARLHLFDGTPPGDDFTGHFAHFAAAFPNVVKLHGKSDVAAVLTELAAEVERRQGSDAAQEPVYLCFYGLQQWRELRKADDDFGYGRREKTASPAQNFGTLIKEGPPLNVHVVCWCDSLTSVQRHFDRALLRDFEMRVLFQMSAADSSALIDGPQASRLGFHHALFVWEEQGPPEKFRPYIIPTAEWLARFQPEAARPHPG